MKASERNSSPTPPKLAPPGAGLPLPQMLFIKLWLGPVVSKRGNWQEIRAGYERLTEKIILAVNSIPNTLRQQKVLVAPIVGLEDSSRYWSAQDTLEHLLIVSKGMEAIILQLAAGKTLDLVVKTADVKPKAAGQDFLGEFSTYAPGLMARLDARLREPGMNRNSPITHRHPWFGPFTAQQWYWVLRQHQSLHYRQIKEIAHALKKEL